MDQASQSNLALGSEHKSINAFERNYIKVQLAGLHKDRTMFTKYFKYVSYYFKLCSQFQIAVQDDIVQSILSQAGDYKEFVYKKVYYNPELIPQQFFLVIKQRAKDLGRKITDYYSDTIEVDYLSDQIVGFRVRDVEWRIR